MSNTMPTVPQTAAEIVAALYAYHQPRGWLAFSELRIGTGYGKDAEQRLDFWAMGSIPSMQFRRVAYEIKISRADFAAELRKPYKRRRALLLSNEFYFIAPRGLLKAEDIPLEAGLAEVSVFWDLGPHYDIHFTHPAPWRDTSPPTWQFFASVVRRAQQKESTP